MRTTRAIIVVVGVTAAAALGAARAGDAIDPAFLAIKDCPAQPGCPALILLDETELNNESGRSRYSVRRLTKLFTEEGIAQYADVEVAATVGDYEVRNLAGRTVRPDGTEIPLKQENIFVKSLLRGKRRDRVKTAKFPGVVEGAIIEYSYDIVTEPNSYLTEMTWYVQGHLPVLTSRFTLKQGKYEIGWKRAGSESVEIKEASPFKHVRYFTATNVPPLPEEPYGPPDDAVQVRLYFDLPERLGSWLGVFAGRIAGLSGAFIDQAPGVVDKLKELVLPADSPIAKVRKIYRFVQEKIGTEEQRSERSEEAGIKDASNVGEVLARGFGNEYERTMLFLALVKEAGLDHGLLIIVGRNSSVFNEAAPDTDQFDSFAAGVKTEIGWTFYDPAAKHCPFGMLSAEKEGGANNAILIKPQKGMGGAAESLVQHLRIKTNRPAPYSIAAIPFSAAGKNVLLREATLQIAADGSVDVSVSEQGSGLTDLEFRDDYETLDEEQRKEALSTTLGRTLPQARLTSASFEDIGSFDKTATIRYSFKLPDAGAAVADRIVLTPSIFSAGRANPFSAATRRTPVHFPHARKTQERITIQVPEGYGAGELPAPTVVRDPPFVVMTSFAMDGTKLIFNRRMEIDAAVWPVADYARLKSFFEKMQETDRQAVVLKRVNPS